MELPSSQDNFLQSTVGKASTFDAKVKKGFTRDRSSKPFQLVQVQGFINESQNPNSMRCPLLCGQLMIPLDKKDIKSNLNPKTEQP